VIEVGPGPGGLTRALIAAGAGLVVAIERDELSCGTCRDREALSGPPQVVAGDALTDMAACRRTDGDRRQPALQHRRRS
jgi:16S rRNA (adenine1518-N6/adenine1519-N6)-dimethyltransferase